jgi:hypothetical protein
LRQKLLGTVLLQLRYGYSVATVAGCSVATVAGYSVATVAVRVQCCYVCGKGTVLLHLLGTVLLQLLGTVLLRLR